MSRSPTLAPLALLAWTLAAAPSKAAAQAPDDARLRQAWSYLSPEEQDDVASWFRAEVEHLGTFQNTLLVATLALVPRDPGLYPEAPPPAWFDPEVKVDALSGATHLARTPDETSEFEQSAIPYGGDDR